MTGSYREWWAARNVAGVYRLMAHDLHHGTHTAPSFDNAVALHKTLSAIEESAETGKRVRVVNAEFVPLGNSIAEDIALRARRRFVMASEVRGVSAG